MLLENEKKYLSLMAEKYKTKDAASAEVIALAAKLYLPKGTEHFLSDIHGEYEAYSHIRRSASGVIRRKIDLLFCDSLSPAERSGLAALIYYPEERLKEEIGDRETIISRLFTILELICEKYTRAKVLRTLLSIGDYGHTIYELLYNKAGDRSYSIKTIVRIQEGESFISALALSIKRLAVDRLHVVGDIFDRGPRADKILDELMTEESVDIQWGNHDILWMGAAAGSPECIMCALFNSLSYRNLDFLEVGYGISLRPLAEFARDAYSNIDLTPFLPKGDTEGQVILSGTDELIGAMRLATAVMMWKLEGNLILRNPCFCMNERLLLDKINDGKITLGNTEYPLACPDLPTLNKKEPYSLTNRESKIIFYLVKAFKSSEKLRRHISFLYTHGGMYKIYNQNLLFHGSVPMNYQGEFLPLEAAGGRCGKELMDYCDSMARRAFFDVEDSFERQSALDFMWFLWCGKNSPLSGREQITTFERMMIADPITHKEKRNPYYRIWDSPALAEKLLSEFGLSGSRSHIINGHIPVKKGENPIKAGGKLILIDGGFCHAFLERTGISGYTLIYNSEGMRISAHEPFPGRKEAIEKCADIAYDTAVFETAKERIRIVNTDEGADIIDKIADLMMLREYYEKGETKR